MDYCLNCFPDDCISKDIKGTSELQRFAWDSQPNSMKLLMQAASICFSVLLCLNFIHCEGTQNGLDMLKWACYCAVNPLRVLNSTRAFNCSTSCHCIPDEVGGSDSVIWNCSCAPVLSPKATDSINKFSCFTSCNCTSGSSETSAGQQKFSNNSVTVILLVFVVITTTALFVSIAFHFYRKVNVALQPRIYSSVKYTSSNSSANLISHRSASFSSRQLQTDTQLCSLTEFLRKIPFISRGEKQAIPGAIIQFSLFELEQATDRFSSANLIGQGGSSNVYRGKLMNGNVVAIKKLKVLGRTEADSSFLTEIELISRLNHCHVVPLVGYCSEYQCRNCERLLIFEYMSNGNLRECLDTKHCKEPLSWATRVSIALGVARGLEYLHEAAAPRIMHRDIKSTNILLDEYYKAKITDLGMAKCLMTDDHPSCSSSPARMLGTFGYFAPEYAIVGKASLQSDVFSYGVVILELITGRQPIHKSPKGDESLVIWATGRLNDSKLIVTELPDPLLKGNFPDDEMQIMAHLARECLQWDPDSRPTMTEIVQILTMIAPEKQQRNFHVNIHMGSFWRSIKSINATAKSQHCSTATLELTQDASGKAQDYSSLPEINQENLERSHAHCYLPSTLNQNNNQEVVLSAEHLQQLTLLDSTIQSRKSSEEEVDLTEPRLESFL